MTIDNKCPIFNTGCPFSSLAEEKSAFKMYLEKCKKFETGCPFKDLDSLGNLKQIMSTLQLSGEYSDDILLTHKNLQITDWNKMKENCPAFKNGCIFGNLMPKNEKKLEVGCPIWKNGCPFKNVVSEGISLVEALQSNSWDILVNTTVNVEGLDDEKEEVLEKPNIHLAKMLKEGTEESHSLAESVQFVRRFRKKEITLEIYKLFIRNLYFVYYAMEVLFDQLASSNENVKRLNFTELKRTTEIEKDLAFFFGESWRTQILTHSDDPKDTQNMSPATANYVQRLFYCAKQSNGGELLIAHAYTRYLGDLSGGQLLKRMARRSLNLLPGPRNATNEQLKTLPDEEIDGTRFYDFLEIDDLVKFKNQYREILDSLNLNIQQADQMVSEANVSFRLNMELFQELDEIAGFTTKEEREAAAAKAVANHPPKNGSQAECPFSAMLSGTKPEAHPAADVSKALPVIQEPAKNPATCPVHAVATKKVAMLLSALILVLALFVYTLLN